MEWDEGGCLIRTVPTPGCVQIQVYDTAKGEEHIDIQDIEQAGEIGG
jgi:hypothetical protein